MLPIILKGGSMMVPLMVESLLCIALIFERYMVFKKALVDTSALRTEVISLLKKGDIGQAITLCANTPGPVSAVLLVGLRKYQRVVATEKDRSGLDDVVTKAMSDYAPHVLQVLEHRLNLLALIGTTAPLLGMTGTVTGMIGAFGNIAATGSMEGPVVAGGISEALITTAAGLVISMPAVIAYNLYARKVERIVLDVEEASTALVDFVTTGAE
jgi:biopolymer transport protein ExbB